MIKHVYTQLIQVRLVSVRFFQPEGEELVVDGVGVVVAVDDFALGELAQCVLDGACGRQRVLPDEVSGGDSAGRALLGNGHQNLFLLVFQGRKQFPVGY